MIKFPKKPISDEQWHRLFDNADAFQRHLDRQERFKRMGRYFVCGIILAWLLFYYV